MKTFLCSFALFLLICTATCSAKSVKNNAPVIKDGKEGEKTVKIDAHMKEGKDGAKAEKIHAHMIKEDKDGAKAEKIDAHMIKEGKDGAKTKKNDAPVIKEGKDGAKTEENDAPVIKESDCSKCPKNQKPMDCAELRENGANESGIYTIYPKSRLSTCESIQVYCDMETDGGGWTVIQRRGQYGNGEDYFSKKWKEYKEGFGNLKKEFWLGNDQIHSITNQNQYGVRMDMKHEDGKTAFTHFENFWIENEAGFYLLRLSEASGPGGDAISNHDGWRFYTSDKPDQTKDGQRSGGWWRNGSGTSSLNGLNLYKTDRVNSGDGINWHTFGGKHTSFESTEIKVRPKKFH